MGIKYISPYDHSGYGTAARRVLIGLRNAGIPFTWTPMVAGKGWDLGYEPFTGRGVGDPDLDPWCNRDIPYDTVIVHLVPEYTLRWRHLEPGKRLILYTAWETDRIPHHWRFFLELADLVLVPSAWNRSVFQQAGLRVPVEVFPHIAQECRHISGSPPFLMPDHNFVFYAIETWTGRKALGDVIRCFLNTFSKDDPVTLALKTTHRDLTRVRPFLRSAGTRQAVNRLLSHYRRPAHLCLITRDLPADDLWRLHLRGDCYVSMSHGEGWGLGSFDAAAHGKPVVMTRYGGALDYLPADSAYLINCRMVPVDNDSGKPSFAGDQQWAQADPVHASVLMRRVLDNRKDAAEHGKRLQLLVHEQFNERKVIGRLMELVYGCRLGTFSHPAC
jgi:glycosyltransferase involved in cell wall biosynthesis